MKERENQACRQRWKRNRTREKKKKPNRESKKEESAKIF
jgi:hypothetical protein